MTMSRLPLVVSLSNHARAMLTSFDKLWTSGGWR
jgi:hypothetical protein